MKILFSHSHVIYKGGWGRTFPFAEELVKQGHEVTIITMANKMTLKISLLKINGVKIVTFPSLLPIKNYYDPISILLKVIYVLFHSYDIVHSDIGQRPQSGLPCRISKRLKGTTYISDWMDYNAQGGQYETKSKFFKLLMGNYELKWEFKDRVYADGVIVLSDLLYKKAIEIRNDLNVVKIHGGSLVDKIPYIEDNSALKLKLGININEITFGYIDQSVSSLIEIQPLIDAINGLESFTNYKILIFGGSKRKDDESIKSIYSNVIQLGWVDFYKEYEKLLAVDIFVLFKTDDLVSKSGWPNALGDYLACGRPVIIKPIGETVDFVKKYSEGFYTVEDPNSLKNILNQLYVDRVTIKQKGKVNRILAEEVISWENKAKELSNFYEEINNRKKFNSN